MHAAVSARQSKAASSECVACVGVDTHCADRPHSETLSSRHNEYSVGTQDEVCYGTQRSQWALIAHIAWNDRDDFYISWLLGHVLVN